MAATTGTRSAGRAGFECRRRGRVAVAALLAVAVGMLGILVPTAGAGANPTIVFDGSPGTAAPPSTLGPYAMTSFGSDDRPLFTTVSEVPDPAGTIGFQPALSHRRIGNGWGTWSHGYRGDVYRTGAARRVAITMPAHTVAFSLYVEPQPFAVVAVTATAQDGTSSGAVPVNGFQGARYFGFYATGGSAIETIEVSAATEFAIGEFAIAVGEPADCTAVTASESVLWPPDGRLHPVAVTDPSQPRLGILVTAVSHDEMSGEPGTLTDDVAVDASGNGVRVRAARHGSGDGRVYAIAYLATNDWGFTCTGTVTVAVPHDRRGGVALGDGAANRRS